MTKDEKFLIELYRQASKNEEALADPTQVGSSLGYTERQIKNILKGLMQGNLVKRYSPNEVALTSRGTEVALSLLK